ncbi:MAG TPA: haloacid dehalogenase-like hydrolase, partial [Labilithrix sp.]|nr:haloacid dehalogenase-like hydrolase [Labilithrix sp.]
VLWPAKPLPGASFLLGRLKSQAAESRDLREEEPFRSLIRDKLDVIESLGARDVLSLLGRTHAGMTDEDFAAQARVFFASARHPRFKVPYTDLLYAPMRELLDYLSEHGFTTYISTGCDQDLIRALAPTKLAIARERVIGATVDKELVFEAGRPILRRTREVASFNDDADKVKNIARRIGRRPIFAVGDVGSGTDIDMLRYTRAKSGLSLALVIQHDDAGREVAYSERNGATLKAAAEHDFLVVSMKNDWARVFDTPGRK